MNKQEPAFPVEVLNDTKNPIDVFGHTVDSNTRTLFVGMTLRDYFAAKALTMVSAGNEHTDMVGWDYRHFAEYAYRMADAMLVERAK